MINIPDNELKKSENQMHPLLQFLTFCAISVFCVGVGYLIGAALIWLLYGSAPLLAIGTLNFSAPHVSNALWIIQIASTTIPLFIAPVFFAYVIVKDAQDYIKPTLYFPWVCMLLVFCIMFISSPLIELLSNINEKMVLPPFLHWMRESEDQAQKLTAFLLKMDTLWQMLFNLICVGLLTAIAEEFMFRGVLQTV